MRTPAGIVAAKSALKASLVPCMPTRLTPCICVLLCCACRSKFVEQELAKRLGKRVGDEEQVLVLS